MATTTPLGKWAEQPIPNIPKDMSLHQAGPSTNTKPVPKPSPHTHRCISEFTEGHALAVCSKREEHSQRCCDESKLRGPHFACPRSMMATPLFRARTLHLKIVPPRLPQPPPELKERARERAENATFRSGAVPRRALRPHRVLEPRLQHVVVLVRCRVSGHYARECSGAQWREELEDVWDLGLFGEDDGCVPGGRVGT